MANRYMPFKWSDSPAINLTLRRGALPKPVQHAMMAKLTEVLMWWEKVPDTPTARSEKQQVRRRDGDEATRWRPLHGRAGGWALRPSTEHGSSNASARAAQHGSSAAMTCGGDGIV